MSYRVHPIWWPLLAPLSPALGLIIAKKSKAFEEGTRRASAENEERGTKTSPLELPVLDSVELKVVVEEKAVDGFRHDPGVSYVLSSTRGDVLFDVGFGPATATFGHNWNELGLSMDEIDAAVISHLHLDHMGGLKGQRRKEVTIPEALRATNPLTCYVPDHCTSPFFDVEQVTGGQLLAETGWASTGPLARMLFFFGYTYEQSLVAHVAGKGLVVVIGCGHPTVEVILAQVRRLSDAPLYALVGGLHYPVTASRGAKAGLQMQRIFGTGKKWNDPINDDDLQATIDALNEAKPHRLLLSAHDSCDHALERFDHEVEAELSVLRAGETYHL